MAAPEIFLVAGLVGAPDFGRSRHQWCANGRAHGQCLVPSGQLSVRRAVNGFGGQYVGRPAW